MLVVGLTGGIASGKSTVASLFADLGIEIIDADIIARELVAPGKPALAAIVAHFGESLLTADGHLNRRALREKVFHNPKQRLWLENLLHPPIREELNARATQAKGPYCILAIPLLTDRKHYPLIKRVLLVDAPEHLQLQRVQQRDQISLVQAKAILTAQSSRETRLALADDIIVNDGDLSQLSTQVQAYHQRYSQYGRS
jgi:dephospho-CoA kinase